MGIRVIPVIGDSHTWGEGVGAEKNFTPPVCCGDLRPLPFVPPFYVNLMRKALNRETGSLCREYEWNGGRTVEAGKPLFLDKAFSLARVFLLAEEEEAEAELSAQGCDPVRIRLQSEGEAPGLRARVAHLLVPEGEVKGLTLSCLRGERVTVYRVELYRGPYALVNCGIGSCPVGVYADIYFPQYVEPLKPYAILFEGCTINDWLRTPSASLYAASLRRMLIAQRNLTPRVLWHTVTPVEGSQVSGQGTVYGDYVEAMRSVAAEREVSLVDCHARMAKALSVLPEEERAPFFYHDPWHPNTAGHRFYAEAIFPELMRLLRD